MDKASHLSVIVDLSPIQWHLSSQSNNTYPLSLKDFLSQLLAFLNMHVAAKHENTLAVFGAFPGKRFALEFKYLYFDSQHLNRVSVMLHSSTDPSKDMDQVIDANSYPPFKVVDSSVIQRTLDEMESLGQPQEEG